MWAVNRHNNYARLNVPLRVGTVLLIQMRPEAAFHFSEFIYFFGKSNQRREWWQAGLDQWAYCEIRSLLLAALIRDLPVKLPIRRVIARQLLFCEQRADHLDRDAVLFKDRVMEGAVGHLAGIHKLFMQRVDLQTAEQIRSLIKRPITSRERTPHFGRGVVHLVPDAVDE